MRQIFLASWKILIYVFGAALLFFGIKRMVGNGEAKAIEKLAIEKAKDAATQQLQQAGQQVQQELSNVSSTGNLADDLRATADASRKIG
jgi:molybdopterin synthase catalytic subunit